MRVLIASDTHGIFDKLSNYILYHDDIDLIIHAGDGVEDMKTMGYESNIPYHVVCGNNDFTPGINFDEIIEIEGEKIFLTHGHQYDVNYGYNHLVEKAKQLGADMTIFGHTHVYYKDTHDGILLLNPGSVSLPRDNNPGFMIMDIDESGISLNRIYLS